MKTIVEYLTENFSLRLYHGSKRRFESFDLKFFNAGSGDGGWLGRGVYLTNDLDYAESYASPDGYLLECDVVLNNPLIITDSDYSRQPLRLMNEYDADNTSELTKILIQKGYDSVMLTYDYDDREGIDGKFIEVCIFNPNNIKIVSYKQEVPE